ncbi:MAG: class I SAM-dependent methyltransferase [Acidobacteriota bacterium]|nr:class I SAM-dependent methyltransferase [Acidobacteriota bacterium]
MPLGEVGNTFVGGDDPVFIGYKELEVIRRFTDLSGASIVDIGCGIGRLTRHLIHENVKDYLGLDIVPEIMQEARAFAAGDPRFRFEIAQDFKIPIADASATLVVAFSVITHMIDEEGFEYIREARRVLKPGGIALFSFLDFMDEVHLEAFFRHAGEYRLGHGDMLKYTTQAVLQKFAQRAGFIQTEFISGHAKLKTSGVPSRLLDVNAIAPTYNMYQSVCAMTA